MSWGGTPVSPSAGAFVAALLAVAQLFGPDAAYGFEELPDSAWIRRVGRDAAQFDSALAAPPDPTSPYTQSSGLQAELARADSVVAAQGGPTAGDSRLLLSWNAPWGHPRASRSRRFSCTADGSSDTLYLALDCGRDSPTFNGFFAELRIRGPAGQVLGPWWRLERGGPNQGQLLCDFGPAETMPGEQPWQASGQGVITWEPDGLGARMRLAYAVPYQLATPVRHDQIYTLARVVFFQRNELPGCRTPVCIEWAQASLAFGLKDETTVAIGERHVTAQSEGPFPCDADVLFAPPPSAGARRGTRAKP